MTAYFLFLIEASICLALFYMVYLLFLKNETFYRLLRVYLISGIILSVIIPGLPSFIAVKNLEQKILPEKESVDRQPYRDTFEKAVYSVITPANEVPVKSQKSFPIRLILLYLYPAGAAFLFFRLVMEFRQIYNLIGKNPSRHCGKYRIVSLNRDHPSFSFFRYIFLNDRNLRPSERNDVLLHEETHLNQSHSFDILILELYKIVFWFNPVVWQYKKSLTKVHECLADEAIVNARKETLCDYQSLLLHQYLSKFNIELAHPFNYSLIKYRIKMMTKTKSQWWAKYKLFFAVPVLLLGLLVFTNHAPVIKSVQKYDVIPKIDSLSVSGWRFNGINPPGYRCGYDNNIYQHGEKSVFIESAANEPGYFSTFLQTMNIKEFKGKRIKMTGYLRTAGSTEKAQMWLRVDNVTRKMATEFDNMDNRPVKDDRNWTRCEIVFDYPNEECAVFFGAFIIGKGKIWFDNVSFEEVSKDIQKTTWNLNEPFPEMYLENTKKYANGVPEKLPVNLDFEE